MVYMAPAVPKLDMTKHQPRGRFPHDICCVACGKVLFKAKSPEAVLRQRLGCEIEQKCKCGHYNRLP